LNIKKNRGGKMTPTRKRYVCLSFVILLFSVCITGIDSALAGTVTVERSQAEPSVQIYRILHVLENTKEDTKVVLVIDGKETVVWLKGTQLLCNALSQQPLGINTLAAIDPHKFEEVSQAAKDLEGVAIGTVNERKVSSAISLLGADHRKFVELLQNFEAKVMNLKEKINSDKEKEVAQRYNTALEMYKDSAILWKAKLTQRGATDSVLYEDNAGYIKPDPAVQALVKKYQFRLERFQYGGKITVTTIPANEAIQTIWVSAKEQLRQANNYLSKLSTQ
jgi:hypothetical protein